MAKVIVIGGGPAGIMAAITAAKNNEVILIERNNEIGAWRNPCPFYFVVQGWKTPYLV